MLLYPPRAVSDAHHFSFLLSSLFFSFSLQSIFFVREAPLIEEGSTVDLKMAITEDRLRLAFNVEAESAQQSQTPKFDPQWAMAWMKIAQQQQEIHDAVSKDPKLFKQVRPGPGCLHHMRSCY